MKRCTKCSATKDLCEFNKNKNRKDGCQSQCKACMKEYKAANKDTISQNKKEYYVTNKAKFNQKAKEWRADNKDKYKQWRAANRDKRNQRERERRKTDEGFRLMHRMRARLCKFFRGVCKSASTMELVGCTLEECLAYLETTKVPGKDYTDAHIDHILPCKAFDPKDPEHQRACCHYTNLQYLPASENLSKSNKIPEWARGMDILEAARIQRALNNFLRCN
jgi:hypothetical protein